MSHTATTGIRSIGHNVRKKTENKQTKKVMDGANYVKKWTAPIMNEEAGNDRHEKKEEERYVHPTSNAGYQNQ